MTAEEFYKSKGFYSAETEYSKQFFGEILEIAEAYSEHNKGEAVEYIEKMEQEYEALQKEVEKLKGLLQYVANNHLCSTRLINNMRKHGILYQALKE